MWWEGRRLAARDKGIRNLQSRAGGPDRLSSLEEA